MIEAYPLSWPANYPRTEYPQKSKFITNLVKARDFVKKEIERLKGKDSVISTNIPLNANGDLRSDWPRYKIGDIGVAVYFTYNDNMVCLCCDHYTTIWDNLHAIGRTIEALRQIDRDHVSDFLNRSFAGFKALPAPGTDGIANAPWTEVLEIPITSSREDIDKAYKSLAKKYHPDAGGSAEQFDKLRQARISAMLHLQRTK